MSHRFDRRRFLQTASLAGFGIWLPKGVAQGQSRSPNERLSFACIGVGGKGSSDTDHVGGLGDVVALCDIDSKRLGTKAEKFSNAKTYSDFRKLLDELATKIDAVVVSTPDHTHAAAALMAMRLGKPVYCQKPLTHSPYEARLMRETAAEQQGRDPDGQPGDATPASAAGVELIRAGASGRSARSTSGPTGRSSTGSRRPTSSPAPRRARSPSTCLGPVPRPRPRAAVQHGLPPARLARLVGLRHRRPRRHGLPHGEPAVHGAEARAADPRLGPQRRDQPRDVSRLGDDHLRVPRARRPPAGQADLVRRGQGRQAYLPSPELFQGKIPSDSGSLLVGEKGSIFSPSDYGSDQVLWRRKVRERADNGVGQSEGSQEATPTGHKDEWVRAIRENDPKIARSNFDYAGA